MVRSPSIHLYISNSNQVLFSEKNLFFSESEYNLTCTDYSYLTIVIGDCPLGTSKITKIQHAIVTR